jgi:hypothetical protein
MHVCVDLLLFWPENTEHHVSFNYCCICISLSYVCFSLTCACSGACIWCGGSCMTEVVNAVILLYVLGCVKSAALL